MPNTAARLLSLPEHATVLILGGGINGCGLFRDLCEQGVDVLLVEKGDFCSGASAASSRLMHGGIKYLETGEFRLVAQSARERNLLLSNAAHYVKPLETVLPVSSLFGGIIPSVRRFLGLKAKLANRGTLITRAGLLLYDLFGRHFRTMPNHRMLGRRKALALMPELNPSFRAVGLYYEAHITHAERLGLELILDGEAANPAARALNYAEVALVDGRLRVRDRISGLSRDVSADIVVNAGGAWIDKVNAALGIRSRHMGGNKGSHLVVRNRRLHDALRGRMVYFGSADGRVNLLYPFMGNVLIGSTDIPEPDPDAARCSEAEMAYMAAVISEVFPDIAVTPDQIVLTWCGVRPLPRSEGLAPGEVSRDHSIAEDRIPGLGLPVLSLIGGKWTTFRGFAEEVADRILAMTGQERRIGTERLAIGGGRGFPAQPDAFEAEAAELSARFSAPLETCRRLLVRYGTGARAVLVETGGRLTPLASLPAYAVEEIAFLCRREKVETLEDVLFRRTDMALSGALTGEVLDEVAHVAGQALGWDDARILREGEASRAAAARNHIAL